MSVATTTILCANQELNPDYEVLSILVVKEVNRIPYARIVLIDGELAKQKFTISESQSFEPGQPVEIKLGYEGQPKSETTVFKGLVMSQRVEASSRGSTLTVDLKDAAVRMTVARKNAIYRNQKDNAIIHDILVKNQVTSSSVPDTGYVHKEMLQYYVTDWDFILSRAQANGLLVSVDDGRVTLAKISTSGDAANLFENGKSEIFNFEIESDGENQYIAVQSVAWDLKNQKIIKGSNAQDLNLSQGNLQGKAVASAIGSDPFEQTNLVPLDPRELQAWSDATLAHRRLAMIRGRMAVPGIGNLKVLDVIGVSGISKRFDGKTLVTGIRQRVDRNGWQTDIQMGISPQSFTEEHAIIDVPAAGLLPGVNGLQIGIVDRYEADPDSEYRVRINLPGMNNIVWARMASIDAGKGRGYFFRPEPGDEVVVGFFNDDPRQAVILGAMYGSKNAPPDAGLPLDENNQKRAIVTKKGTTIGFVDAEKSSIFIETPAKNKIILDDDAQGIQITDQHGNSIKMSKDGIEIKSSKDFKIDVSGNVEIKGSKVDIK